jgi:CO dehydrogenase/acetyl-CoA synthase delta subunit
VRNPQWTFNLAKQLNVLITQLGIGSAAIVMNPGSAAAGYGFEYVISTFDRIKAQVSARMMPCCRPP